MLLILRMFTFVFVILVAAPPAKAITVTPDAFLSEFIFILEHPTKIQNNTDLTFLHSQFQQELAKNQNLNDLAKELALSLSKLYLQNGSIQDAIWILNEAGLEIYSNKIVAYTEDYLKNMPVIFGDKIGCGTCNPTYGKIGNIDVVIKGRDKVLSIESEVWSYKVDQTIGFNLTPIAIKRNINGRDYSVHILVPFAKPSGLSFWGSGYSQAHSDIYIFDYIIGQFDRHKDNSMWNVNNKLFAIDHGRVFGSTHLSYHAFNYNSAIMPSKHLQEKILSFDEDELRELLIKFAPPDVVFFILVRLNELRNHLLPVNPETAEPHFFNKATLQLLEQAISQRDPHQLKRIAEGVFSHKSARYLSKHIAEFISMIKKNIILIDFFDFSKIIFTNPEIQNKKILAQNIIEQADFFTLSYLIRTVFSQKYTSDWGDLLDQVIIKSNERNIHELIHNVFTQPHTRHMEKQIIHLMNRPLSEENIKDLVQLVFSQPHTLEWKIAPIVLIKMYDQMPFDKFKKDILRNMSRTKFDIHWPLLEAVIQHSNKAYLDQTYVFIINNLNLSRRNGMMIPINLYMPTNPTPPNCENIFLR